MRAIAEFDMSFNLKCMFSSVFTLQMSRRGAVRLRLVVGRHRRPRLRPDVRRRRSRARSESRRRGPRQGHRRLRFDEHRWRWRRRVDFGHVGGGCAWGASLEFTVVDMSFVCDVPMSHINAHCGTAPLPVRFLLLGYILSHREPLRLPRIELDT